MVEYRVRAATRDDRDFLVTMLVAAANAPHGTATTEQVLSDPQVARYVTGWPRESDISLIAETSTGVAAGAVWLRFFTADEPAFGYVSDDVPELAIGVAPERRGHGIGGRLLQAVAAAARSTDVPAISLSVESDNPAVRLYEARGYRTISRNDHAQLMLLRLGVDTATAH